MDQSVVFFLLHNGLVVTLIATGVVLSRKNRLDQFKYNYWLNTVYCLLIYSIVEGLRYDRGTDYMHHKNLIDYANHLEAYWADSAKIEPLFQIINKTAKLFGLPYYLVFFLYSLILIISIFSFLRSHRQVILYAVPLAFFATIVQSENLIRQFLAFAFILFSIKPFLKNSWIPFGILFFMAISIHTSSIFYLPLFFICKYRERPFINLYVILILYGISWLWKAEYMLRYLDLIMMIAPNKYAAYLANEDVWTRMKFDGTIFYLVRVFCFNLGILILGYRLLEKYKDVKFPFFYNLFVFGAITQHLGLQSELIYRVSLLFYIFWFIVLSYIAYDSLTLKNKNIWIKAVSVFLLLNSLYDCISKTFRFEDINLFVWDT